MMDHSGEVLLESPAAENKLRMGVTTLIGGEGGTPVPAESIAAYFSRLERQGIAVNFGTYYSAAQARVARDGRRRRPPTPAQLAKMKADVALAMQAGALGISERAHLSARQLPVHRRPDRAGQGRRRPAAASTPPTCGTRARTSSPAIREAVEIGEQGGVKVEIFHLKAAFAARLGPARCPRLSPRSIGAARARRRRGRGYVSLSGRRHRPQHHGAQLGL